MTDNQDDTPRKARLIQGSIGNTLFKLTLPMLAGILGMVAFNLIDTYFVGQLGTDELAAMSFTFPVVFLLSGLTMGIGSGTSAVISKAIGQGNRDQIKHLATDSLLLSILIVAVFVMIGFLTFEPVFKMLNAPDHILPLIKQYMMIWYAGMLFVVVPMVGNNAIRATGDAKTPGFIMLFAVIINAVLDPMLIFGVGPFPRMELAGAALATVIARAVTLVLALYVLIRREKMITTHLQSLTKIMASWKQILFIGLPAGISNIILPVGFGIITRLIASYGPEFVAAIGVGLKIDMFMYTPVMALATVLGPFIGQNMGARNWSRVRRSTQLSAAFTMFWGFLFAVIFFFTGRWIASLFNDNAQVIDAVQFYLRVAPICYGLHGVLYLTTASLNVLHKPYHATGLVILRIFVLFVPLAFIGSTLYAWRGIYIASPVSSIIAGILGWLWLQHVIKKEENTE